VVIEIDSDDPAHDDTVAVGDPLTVGPRSIVVLRGLVHESE
jgi:hypothetical protein